MTYKACNDKDCSSKGMLLPEEDFPMRSDGKYRLGSCRVCTSRKAKAKRKAKNNEQMKKRPAKKKAEVEAEADLFNSMNRRW